MNDLLSFLAASPSRFHAVANFGSALEDIKEMAWAYHDKVVPAMTALRSPVDELELLVDKDIWPVPTYGDLMFEV